MNKLTMTLIATSVLSANITLAETKVYGKINLSLNKVDEELNKVDVEDNFQLVSHASRLGFKGDADILDGLKALAKIEYEVGADDGKADDDELKARNIYVGVQGDWGRVIAGHFDTPLKSLSKKADQFNDYFLGDLKEVVSGEDRIADVIQYSSPSMSGVKVHALAQAGEDSELSGDNPGDDNGINGFSVVVDWGMDNFSVGLGANSNIKGRDTIRLATNWDVAEALTLGALLQTSENNDSDDGTADETGVVVSLAYKIDAWKLKAQYGMSEIDEDTDDNLEKTQIVLGADYKIAKTTKAYGYLALNDQEQGDAEAFENTFGIGLEHKF
jgi:predicted porin